MDKKLGNSKATARLMKTAMDQPTSQPEAQVNQLRHQVVSLPPKRRGRSPCRLTNPKLTQAKQVTQQISPSTSNHRPVSNFKTIIESCHMSRGIHVNVISYMYLS